MSEKVILLIEDNPDDVALTLRAFKKTNLKNRIDVVYDGVQAVEYLLGESARPLPQLVLLDLKLPKIDGLEVLKRLRHDARTRLLPIVVLTSSKEQEDLLRSYDLGANSYIRKPVDFNQFFEVMQHIGVYWLIINESPLS